MQLRVPLSISLCHHPAPSLASILRCSTILRCPPPTCLCPEEGEIVMAQIARNNEAERATDNVAELGKRTTDKGTDVAREVIERTEGTARRGFETVQQAAGAALEVERAVARRSA